MNNANPDYVSENEKQNKTIVSLANVVINFDLADKEYHGEETNFETCAE